MIHIIHFSSRPGGIEVLIPVFVKALPNYFFSTFVIRKPNKDDANIYNVLNAPTKFGSNNTIIALIKTFIFAYKYKDDKFHVFNIGPFFLLMLRLAGVKKLIYGIHGTIYWQNQKQKIIRKPFWWLAISKNYVFTSNSEYSKQKFLNQVYSKANIYLLYNPIDTTKFTISQSQGVNIFPKFRIIYSGRLANGKNLFVWLRIAALIKETRRDVVFEVFGEGPLKKELIHEAENLGLGVSISFKGYTPNITQAYQNADLLIFLSEYESFGNVVVESILCGTPVIASAIPSMKEIFINYPEFIVELDENLEQNVLKKIENIDNLKSLIPIVRKEFMERFSLEQHIQKLEKIYNSFNNQEPRIRNNESRTLNFEF